MVYVILNVLAVLLLSLLARRFDDIKMANSNQGGFVISILLLTAEAILFSLTLIFQKFWGDTMTKLLLKLMFMVESVFLVSLFFSFLEVGFEKKHGILFFVKIACSAFALFFVYTKFRSFEFSYNGGIYVPCDYVFEGDARQYFPWTWYSVYNFVFRLVLPSLGCFLMLMLREKKATPLQVFQGVLFVEAIIVLWALTFFLSFIADIIPSFSLLYMYAYLMFFVFVYNALIKGSVPSGRGVLFNVIRVVLSYVVPGGALGVCFVVMKPMDAPGFGTFEFVLILASAIAVIFAWKMWDLLMSTSRSATNDYEANFEKGLAKINYSGEMDIVTGRMFDVFKSNVECSSMSIYVDDGHGTLIPAFSSNGNKFSTSLNNPLFDTLLNINESVVIWSEIEDNHEYDGIRDKLKALFTVGKFDAMIILNEGHNIVGVITLGKRGSGDHYKEFDKAVFKKLYSYFFVFGYYIRNISNKEVLGTVNREIKMSSQIITSIQENIDQIKTNKVDIGYMMVPAHNIGGEFIDLIRLTETRHLIVVGDLSGKGIAASMNMVILKSIIRTYLAETHDFKQLVAKINVFIRTSLKKGTIFSGLFALIDFETDTMYYINCGIPALCMYTRVYNNVIEIQGSGNVLGFVKDITPYLSVKTTKLSRGDIILACTDGLINSHSLRGEKFGKERVAQAVLDNSTYPAQRMAQFTFEGLLKFMSKEMEDDVSILVMKYKTAAEFASAEEIAAEKAEEEQRRLEEKNDFGNDNQEEVVENEITETAEDNVFDNEDVIDADADQSEPEENQFIPEEIPGGADFEIPVPDFEMPGEDAIAAALSSEDNAAESEEISGITEEEVPVPQDDFFVENISSDQKKEETFDFDPSAFGLPDDFTL